MSAVAKKKSNDLKLYRTKQKIDELKSKRGFHTELISLYIPHDKKISDVTNYLKNEISESQNIKSKLTRKNVLDSINSLLGQLKNIKEIPENGLVMFSGAIPQNNTPGTERNELTFVEPPDKVNTFRYHCASEFLLWPLEDMLTPKESYGLLVIGRKKSALGYIKGNTVKVVKEFSSGIGSKHGAGGQSQRRFERLNEEAEIAFYRRISDVVNEYLLGIEDLQGIFIGGPGPSKDIFVKEQRLDYRLRDKILDVVDIGYGGAEGIRALIEKVKEQMENVKYIREKEVMQRFMKEISSESGLGTYGLEEIQRALNYGAVDKLLLSEKLDTHEVKLGCSNCDYTENRTLKERLLDQSRGDIQEESCPNCSSNSFKILEIKSIIEELGEIAESTGTDVEILSTETEEGDMLYSTFGGIAAILRYKIDY
ncbi:MAG: peptide chain release factor aRF-1 [Promethearchaeota archaeon]|nr:MAG: peptide chain release factor aRF-1 [Candidatus Lokiarchaeota archaeon]